MLLHIFIAAQDSNSQKENIHLRYLDCSKYTEYLNDSIKIKMYIFTSKIGFILQVFEYNPPGDTHIRPDS
jgi:hypothetical protein